MVFSDLWQLKSEITALQCSPRSFGSIHSFANFSFYNSVRSLSTYNWKTETAFSKHTLKIQVPRLPPGNVLSLSRNSHLGYFISSFPSESLRCVPMSVSHHAARSNALTCWFLELQDQELDQEPSLGLTQNAPQQRTNAESNQKSHGPRVYFATANKTG